MNPVTVNYLNLFLGTGTIALQVLSVIALFLLFARQRESRNFYLDFIDKHFFILSFAIALFASVFPLVYSEIIGFLPCALCWWQRVFMVPLLFIFAVALWNKDRAAIRFALPLAALGFLVSLYQNFNYYFADSSGLPCDASGVSCYQRVVSVFGGYISIPMMALTAFFAILTLLSVAHFYQRKV